MGNGDDGTGNCTVCPLGTFWAGPEKLRFRQEGRDQRSRDYASFDSYSDGYHSGGGYDGSDEYSPDGYSSYGDYQSGYGGGRARVGDLSPPPGVQPCDNCSLVFPNGGSTTLFQGSSSSKDCVCAPGGSHHRTAQQAPCLLSNQKLWTPTKASWTALRLSVALTNPLCACLAAFFCCTCNRRLLRIQVPDC